MFFGDIASLIHRFQRVDPALQRLVNPGFRIVDDPHCRGRSVLLRALVLPAPFAAAGRTPSAGLCRRGCRRLCLLPCELLTGQCHLLVELPDIFLVLLLPLLVGNARVFALGVVKARDPRLMRIFAANVDTILGGEMEIHRTYMARLGITEEQVFAVKPALDNLSYTNYMLSVASTGGPAEIVASILACSWSYAEIGQALARIPGAAEHPFYGEWIRGYASDSYAATNHSLIELMDALAADASGEQLAQLTDIFVNCSRYELGFWDMSWEMRA